MPESFTMPVPAPSLVPIADASSTTENDPQGTLFDLAQIEGFGALSRRERLFAEAIVLGMSQREAARAAGVKGQDSAIDVIASRLARKPEVRRFLSQCWDRSGASIAETLRQATRIQARAWRDYEEATNKEARASAHKEWREASALIASIHGRLGVRIEGDVRHHHSGAVAAVTVPAEALDALARMRRDVLIARRDGELPNPTSSTKEVPSA